MLLNKQPTVDCTQTSLHPPAVSSRTRGLAANPWPESTFSILPPVPLYFLSVPCGWQVELVSSWASLLRKPSVPPASPFLVLIPIGSSSEKLIRSMLPCYSLMQCVWSGQCPLLNAFPYTGGHPRSVQNWLLQVLGALQLLFWLYLLLPWIWDHVSIGMPSAHLNLLWLLESEFRCEFLP